MESGRAMIAHAGLPNSYGAEAASTAAYISNRTPTTVVAVYMDDLILITETAEEMQNVKESLAGRFKMKDMDKASLLSWD